MTVKLDREKCKGCGTCVTVCPVNLYSMGDDGKAVFKEGGDAECLKCHACEINCPAKAIVVTDD